MRLIEAEKLYIAIKYLIEQLVREISPVINYYFLPMIPLRNGHPCRKLTLPAIMVY